MTAPTIQRALDMRATLAKTWPRLFALEHSRTWPPLAVGIFDQVASALQIEADEQATQALRRALASHARSLAYLRALAAGRPRHDLEGKPAGEVTTEQRDKASAEVTARLAERAKNKPAQQPHTGKHRATGQRKQSHPAAPPPPWTTATGAAPVVKVKKRRAVQAPNPKG